MPPISITFALHNNIVICKMSLYAHMPKRVAVTVRQSWGNGAP